METTESTGKTGTGKIVLAALGGAVAGATVALLVAPKSGKETRAQLSGYVDDARKAVARVPTALKSASHAVRETLAEELGSHKDEPTAGG